jgi:hypothetical protein
MNAKVFLDADEDREDTVFACDEPEVIAGIPCA